MMLGMFESEKDTAVMHEYIIPGMVQLGFTVDEMQQTFNVIIRFCSSLQFHASFEFELTS